MAFTSIVASDLNGKGVVGLPDTPQLTTEEMQQKFDELALSVLVPAFNRLVSELGAQSAASNIGISLPEGSALDSNVAAVINWMLSDISESDQLRHSHANKAVLDLITLAVKTGYDRLVTLLASITEISATVKNSADSIPTGKAISEYISGLGGGDMLKSVYDTDNTGVVDNSEKLGGQLPSFYQKATDNTLTTANKTISGAINEINGKEVEVVDPMTATEPGTAADAKLTGDALKELNAKSGIVGIDTSNRLGSLSTKNTSYTATEDCYVCGYMAGQTSHNASVLVDGVEVVSGGSYDSTVVYVPVFFPAKKGQTIKTGSYGNLYNIKIYGVL